MGTTDSINSLASTALRLPLVASAFGMRQLAYLLSTNNPGAKRSAESDLYRVAAAAQAQFDTNSVLFAAFSVGDAAQRALTDFAFDTLTLKAFKPSYLKAAGRAIAKGSVDAWESLGSPEALRLTVDKIRNNFKVVDLVNGNDAPVTLTSDGDYPLEEVLEKAYSLGEYPALWSVEGLGENYADAYLGTGKPVRGLLTTGKGAALPDKSLLMMHAGAGIAFAKHIVTMVTPWSSDAEFATALKLFLELVEQNSRPGYEGAALESLGLVTRTWHEPLLQPLSRHLAAINPAAAEFFWHGAGRAMYFTPVHFIPGFSPYFAADQEPPDAISRLNARAGATWAFTVVNIQQPEIAATFLKNKGVEISGNDGYFNGVHSTLIMAGDMVPGDVYVDGFCSYKPDPKDPALVDLWNKNIGVNCGEIVANAQTRLKAQGKLGEIFRYHPADWFTSDAGTPPSNS